ncbi:MAG: nucleoside transporter C-terminal domain-containing protein [Thermodesulfobacteriota bacterium]
MMLQGAVGIIAFVLLAWLISENRGQVRFTTPLIGIGLQFALAVVFLKSPGSIQFFKMLNRVILAIETATNAGTSFVFGYLGGSTSPSPFDITNPQATFILAFQALPIILIMSALSSLLFYWRVLPAMVNAFSWLLGKVTGIGGAEGVGLASNIFLGMVESPLLIRPYLKTMTRSELFSVMTCGLAGIAGTVMALYASFLSKVLPEAMGHILTASVISVPASITIAKIMIPETGSITDGKVVPSQNARSSMDAITLGTIEGVQLLINIVAMLIVLVALVYMANLGLSFLPWSDGNPLTLQRLLGYLMAPVVWLMGIPWSESVTAGTLMGTKSILNELLAYVEMARLPEGALSSKSLVIMTYALCGFANPGSLGIMIGGMGTMVPERRDEIVSLGVRSVVAGTMATCMTGAVIGLIV